MNSLKLSIASILCCTFVLATALGVQAFQSDPNSEPPPVQAALQTPDQLQQLVAPIALYPDSLVGQVLAAATYPAQVVEADRWVQQHRGLKGVALAQAADKQPWDASTKALTQFPAVLANMDKNLAWTSALGDAYVNQPQDVLDAVQTMRRRAEDAGNLQTNSQQTVTNDGQTVVIEPADPQVVYVPEYDPWVVYGGPLVVYPGWAPYPGLYLDRPGIEFGVFAGFSWGWHGWDVDWHGHHVLHNHTTFVSHTPTFVDRGNIYRGRQGGALPAGLHAGAPGGRPAPAFHRTPAPNLGSASRPTAFSSFNHGGVARNDSVRGQTSLGSAVRAPAPAVRAPAPAAHSEGGGARGGGGSRTGGGGRR